MSTARAAKRPAKSNRKRPDAQLELTRMLDADDLMTRPERPIVAIEQKASRLGRVWLIYEVTPDGTRRLIGKHVSFIRLL